MTLKPFAVAYAAAAPVVAVLTAYGWLHGSDDDVERDDFTTAAAIGVAVGVGWPLLATVRLIARGLENLAHRTGGIS